MNNENIMESSVFDSPAWKKDSPTEWECEKCGNRFDSKVVKAATDTGYVCFPECPEWIPVTDVKVGDEDGFGRGKVVAVEKGTDKNLLGSGIPVITLKFADGSEETASAEHWSPSDVLVYRKAA